MQHMLASLHQQLSQGTKVSPSSFKALLRNSFRGRLRARAPVPGVEVAFRIVFKFVCSSKQPLSIGNFIQPRLCQILKRKRTIFKKEF